MSQVKIQCISHNIPEISCSPRPGRPAWANCSRVRMGPEGHSDSLFPASCPVLGPLTGGSDCKHVQSAALVPESQNAVENLLLMACQLHPNVPDVPVRKRQRGHDEISGQNINTKLKKIHKQQLKQIQMH